MFIYKIKNLVNGKVYIGQTTKSPNTRFTQHKSRLRRNIHDNQHLQFAWNKYGKHNFIFEAIDSGEHIFCLDNLERYWIRLFDSMNPNNGYNKQSGGYNRRVNSTETRLKISRSNTGKKRTEEVRQNMSIRRMGNCYAKGHKMTDASRKQMSLSKLSANVSRKVVIDIVTGETFLSVKHAAEAIGMKYSTLRGQLNGSDRNNTNFRYLGDSTCAC